MLRSQISFFSLLMVIALGLTVSLDASEPEVINLWPEKPPGPQVDLPPEKDTTTAKSNLVAGRRLMRITNVSIPQIAIHRPEKQTSDAAVVICPGGGHRILAYDLEGTEVADWLNELGITGIVLKYRVPTQTPNRVFQGAVQDAQRAVSLVRSRAQDWGLNPDKIGILGFSAGGQTAALTSLFLDQREYETVDEIDQTSCRPDFTVLIYPAYLVPRNGTELDDYVSVSPEVPPTFFAHAFDDPITPLTSLLLAAELKKVKVPVEVHVYAKGGHGYGLRKTEMPCSRWPEACETWMRAMDILD